MASSKEKALYFLSTQFEKPGQLPEVKIACAKGIGFAGAKAD